VVPGAAGGVRGATVLAPVRTTPEVRLDGRPTAAALVGAAGALAAGAAAGAAAAAAVGAVEPTGAGVTPGEVTALAAGAAGAAANGATAGAAALASMTAGLGSTDSVEVGSGASLAASSPFFFLGDFAVVARFFASTTSTFSAVSTAVPPAAPENHSRMVSERPTDTVDAALETPSICSRWHFSTTSLLVTPSSLASWLILILLPLGVLNRCSFCGGSGQSLLVWMMVLVS
jgi:hypothetical protein